MKGKKDPLQALFSANLKWREIETLSWDRGVYFWVVGKTFVFVGEKKERGFIR